jgi:hypothetical protein
MYKSITGVQYFGVQYFGKNCGAKSLARETRTFQYGQVED